MTLKEATDFIDGYSQKLESKFGKYEDNEKLILSSTVKLTEELGELCNEVLVANSRQRKEKLVDHKEEALAEEFADVFLALLMLAKDMHLNLDDAVKNKIEKIKKRD